MELLDTVSNTDDNGNDFSKNAVELIGLLLHLWLSIIRLI